MVRKFPAILLATEKNEKRQRRSTYDAYCVEDTVSNIVTIQRRHKLSFMLDRFTSIAVFISELLKTLFSLSHSDRRNCHHADSTKIISSQLYL